MLPSILTLRALAGALMSRLPVLYWHPDYLQACSNFCSMQGLFFGGLDISM